MNRISAVIRMQLRKKLLVFAMPWLILGSSFVVNLLIAMTSPMPDGEGFYTGGIASIFVYLLIQGIITPIQTFPFTLGLGIHRSDYYWGTALATTYILFLFSLGLFLLSIIEGTWTDHWGVDLHFFDLPYWSDGSLLNRWWNPFALLLNQFWLGFMISSFFKRFGKTGMLIATIASIVIGTLGLYIVSYQNWWPSIGEWFSNRTMAEITLWTLPVTFVFAALSKLFVRRTTL
ncbi:hypothetical protein [Paenibacillus kobensis]|uniref:hypothetical protein n=1 Tax=Paenibacillus kobensis TaxID=59841 RepID=UPI000FD71479|nr:hypothetical protein [Paenibacillus kobensis]